MPTARRLIALSSLVAVAVFLSGCVIDFSPDGHLIVAPWRTGLSIDSVDGASRQPVAGGASGLTARWSPNGRYVLFATGQGTPEVKLYDTTTQTSKSIGGNMSAPFAWRPDSGWFTCTHRLANGSSELVSFDVRESGVSQRSPIPFKPAPGGPMVWLPTTNDVALMSQDANVYTVEAGEAHKVTTSNDVIGLALSPDGKALRWARKGPNLRYILMTVYEWDLTARTAKRLPFPARVAALNPDPHHAPLSVDYVEFSSDGSRLALVVSLPEAPTGSRASVAGSSAVYVVGMNGSGGHRVSEVSPPVPPGGASNATSPGVTCLAPRFSHDGSQIAIYSQQPGGGNLAVGSAASGALHTLRSEGSP